MNLFRRKFLQMAGAGAAFGAIRGGRGLPPAAETVASSVTNNAVGKLRNYAFSGVNEPEQEFDPLADCTKRIALLKAMPEWYFRDRYGVLALNHDFNCMRSWSRSFMRIAEHDYNLKHMRKHLIQKAKMELKSFLWQKAGKDFP